MLIFCATPGSTVKHYQKILPGCSANGRSYLMLEITARIVRQYGNARVVFVKNCNEWVQFNRFHVDSLSVVDWMVKAACLVQAIFAGFHGDKDFNQIAKNIDAQMTASVSAFISNLAQELSKFCDARKAAVKRNGESVSLPLRPIFFFDNIEAVFGLVGSFDRDVQVTIKELKNQGFFIIGASENNAFMGQMSGSNPPFAPIIVPRTLSNDEAHEYRRAVFLVYHAVHTTEAPRIEGGVVPFINHLHIHFADDGQGYMFALPRRAYFSYHQAFPHGLNPFAYMD